MSSEIHINPLSLGVAVLGAGFTLWLMGVQAQVPDNGARQVWQAQIAQDKANIAEWRLGEPPAPSPTDYTDYTRWKYQHDNWAETGRKLQAILANDEANPPWEARWHLRARPNFDPKVF